MKLFSALHTSHSLKFCIVSQVSSNGGGGGGGGGGGSSSSR
jgi:hypothetical protein